MKPIQKLRYGENMSTVSIRFTMLSWLESFLLARLIFLDFIKNVTENNFYPNPMYVFFVTIKRH